MNICLLTRFFEFKGSGVTRLSTKVYEGLTNRGHTVYPISDGNTLYSYFIYTALEIPVKLPRHNIDVYHALATLEAMWLPRDRSIATFLDLFTTTNPERAGAGMGYNRWKLEIGRRYFDIGSRLASRCRILTAISEKTKEDMIQYLHIPESKIRVIPLGINDELEPQPRKDDTFRVGTLGQFDKRKRIDLLIREFKRSRMDAELVVAGQGMDRPILESLAGNDPRIKFLGLVPDDSLSDFFASLDVFIFPTSIEGLGLPVLEAFACKKPVVILSDAIMPNDIWKRCANVESLGLIFNNTKYLDNICNHVNYESNYQFAKEHSWTRNIDAYEKLYGEIVG